ncbi:Chromatin assembly factor 1 subunit [Vanrija albida]|uniref:Chromatin assembly factor 1 subunit n=1 Tax=Vanrija albida TaxID=181172 RepID=A0ABR3QD68_9TREE
MRPKVLEIAWHETQAIYSCDFQPLPVGQLKRLLPTPTDEEDKAHDKGPVIAGGRSYRLATCGGDFKVRLWMVYPNIPSVSASTHAAVTRKEVTPHPPRVEYLATLHKHSAAVNVVRFSPNGQLLASAGDDGNVILWVLSDRPISNFGEAAEDAPDKEHWRPQKMLQVTNKHVYDLAWSPDSEFFIAGSTDNTATIWKASSGECIFALREHLHNVQGVAWDPLNEYIATQSSDRAVHVNTFAFRNGVPDVHPVSRATRMEIRHSRTPSIPSGPRPGFARRGSTASEAGSVITTASEVTDHPIIPGGSASAIQPPATPSSTSVPSTPVPSAMNPPPPGSAKPSSRRSSFSSQHPGSPALSVAAMGSNRGRSPSPIPPLPAMRAVAPTTAIMQRLYGEESMTRFFRRLTFSPDGSLLLTPAGQIEDQVYKGSPLMSQRSLSTEGFDGPPSVGGDTPSGAPPTRARPLNVDAGKPTVYIYSRGNLARAPIAHLPGHKTASVAIRFSPIFYDLRTAATGPAVPAEPKQITLDVTNPSPVHVSLSMPPPPPPQKEGESKDTPKPLGSVFALPYRLFYAVACQDAVLLYDTQQAGPVAIFRGLHYAGFTDIAWSPDGQVMMLSSADGYCSIVVFDFGELGTVHATQQHHRQLAAIAHSHGGNHGVSSAAATPMPLSPSVPTMRASPAPPRSERESSVASSAAYPGAVAPPLFAAGSSSSVPINRPPSSSASSVDVPLPTPSDDFDHLGSSLRTPESSSGVVGLGLGEEVTKRERGSEKGTVGAVPPAKKKRRVALTHLGDEAA